MKHQLTIGGIGALFGVVLSRIGFTSWDEIHRMFTFADFHLLLVFAVAITVLSSSWLALHRLPGARWTPRPVHPGTLVGGALFGIGWALSGACPSIVLVQLGEGQLAAAFTLLGILLGNWLYSVVHERYFRWSPGVCIEP